MRRPLRLAAALLVAAVAVAVLVALRSPGPAPSAAASYPVQIVGGDGRTIFDGTVVVANATALSVLQAASEVGGFDLEVQGAGCPSAYIRRVGGQGESGAGGWTFRIAHAGQDWGLPPSESAACCPLRPGDRLEWRWSTEGTLGPPCQ